MSLAPLESKSMSMEAADDFSTTVFMELPLDLKLMIINELDLMSFVKLRVSSTEMWNVCKKSCVVYWSITYTDKKFRLDHENGYEKDTLVTDAIPAAARVRAYCVDVQCGDISDGSIYGRTTLIRSLIVGSKVVCTPEALNKFLMKHHVEALELEGRDSSTSDFLKQTAVTRLVSLCCREFEGSVRGADILALRASDLVLPLVEFETINALIKEWQSGQRTIGSFLFEDVAGFEFDYSCPGLLNDETRARLLDGVDFEPANFFHRNVFEAIIRRPGATLTLSMVFDDYAQDKLHVELDDQTARQAWW